MPRGLRHALSAVLVVVVAIGCQVREPSIPDPEAKVIDVRAFGAVGDGLIDDRPAIQTALDAAEARQLPVRFPAGRYLLNSSTAPGDRVLRTYPSQHLWGVGAQNSILVVGNAIGEYVTVLGAVEDKEGVLDWSMNAMGIDQRASAGGALNVQTMARRPRMAVRLGDHMPGGRVRILDSAFTDSDSVNVLYVFAETVEVTGNVFSDIGGPVGTQTHDHSTVYVSVPVPGGTQVIAGNRFAGIRASGGARTAIETHGGRQTILNNTIADYLRGMNLTSTSGAEVPLVQVQQNRIDRAAIGIQLWAGGAPQAHELGDVELLHNIITLDGRAWQSLGLNLPTSGVLVTPSNTAPVRGLQVSGNHVTYLSTTTRAFANPYTAAISCKTTDPRGRPTWLRIDHNVFIAAPSTIDRACRLQGAMISANRSTN